MWILIGYKDYDIMSCNNLVVFYLTAITVGSCRDTLRNVLLSVYGNKESVDEELVEV